MRHRVTFNETRLRVLGLDDPLSSTDWDRKVEFDATARTTREYQALDATSTQTVISEHGWDTNSTSDRLLWSKASNQITRIVYSDEGWVTDSYGPANAACFDAVTKKRPTAHARHQLCRTRRQFAMVGSAAWPSPCGRPTTSAALPRT